MTTMNAHTTLRRSLCALGATAALGLALASPALAEVEPGPGGRSQTTTVTKPYEVPVDDNALEPAQLGAGILAGLALAGAGMAVASRRRHAALHPA
jgi:F0F1-type ATP synthase membrane subunit c/vacuolar-type H+-ATPase subunit K